jgi:deoxyadenosine/deoxycytidine kinase
MSVRRPIRSDLASRRETRAITYLAIEGPPGVGKTALASLLGRRLGGRLMLDRAAENPFMEEFHRDPALFAFKTQIFLTLSRYVQQQEISQQDLFHSLVITDYLFVRDRIYASLTLDDRELALYEKLVGLMEPALEKPDLVIYLQSSADALIDRIESRNSRPRGSAGREFIVALVEAYNYYFLHYQEAPLLVVNTSDVDPAANEQALVDLLDELQRPQAGIRFYNPMAVERGAAAD